MFFRVLKRAFCYILLDWINLQEKIATLLRYMWTLYVNIMASLWLHNSKFTSYTKTFLNPYTWQFLKTYLFQSRIEITWKSFVNQTTLKTTNLTKPYHLSFFSLVECFPCFLKLLYSVYDSLSEYWYWKTSMEIAGYFFGWNLPFPFYRIDALWWRFVDLPFLNINLRKQ